MYPKQDPENLACSAMRDDVEDYSSIRSATRKFTDYAFVPGTRALV